MWELFHLIGGNMLKTNRHVYKR